MMVKLSKSGSGSERDLSGKDGKNSGSKPGEKLKALKQKQAVLKAKIEQMEAREKTTERKQDVRRKILLGAFVLEEATKDGKVAELYQKMDSFLVRNSDRVLFGLALLEQEGRKKTKTAVGV